jgi:carnosine N-methyltransferase
MLITSSFVMNQLGGQPLNVVQLYPFVHESTNLRQLTDQIDRITVPDVDPSVLPADSNLSMVAGEFISTYESQVNSWDVVASCFFLDTAKNVLAYLECISKILKPGGTHHSLQERWIIYH